MTITVDCPSCSTSFPVDPAKVPEGGVHARCSVCQSVFFVAKPAQIDDTPTAVEPTPDEVRAPESSSTEDTSSEVAAPVAGGQDEPGRGEAGAENTLGSDTSAGGDVALQEQPAAEDHPTGPTGADEWVIEREPDLDPAALDVQPMETVESSQEGFEVDVADEVEHTAPPVAGWEGSTDSGTVAGEVSLEESSAEPATPDEGRVPEAVPAPSAPGGFQFGRRDPTEKAQRLARVLVSDMIIYNPERHARALENDSLPEDFDDEIKKSWEEYVDQVGDDLARSTSYFTDALNEILAKGSPVFSGSPPTA